jgi:hypothetical protein
MKYGLLSYGSALLVPGGQFYLLVHKERLKIILHHADTGEEVLDLLAFTVPPRQLFLCKPRIVPVSHEFLFVHLVWDSK